MARLLLISIALVAALIIGTSASNCHKCKGQNEEWKKCGACDGTCENKHAVCPAICRESGSCGCKTGYVRNSHKICIKEENCPRTPICGINEEYKPCGACDQGCDYAVDCIQGCREGACGCKSGYLRSNGTCVLSEDCPKSTNCGENEEFYECGACDQGCNYATRCDTRCREGSCGCKKGYVRNDDRICIPQENCQKTPSCGENEELKGCGACDGTCKDPNVACTEQCRPPECGCMKGYVRDNGKCILLKSCPKPPTCGLHEEIKGCGACDGTCQEPNPVCTLDCRPPECGCMKGYVRDNGKCILLKSCPKPPICGPNEELNKCGACEGTCKEPNAVCSLICRQPECGCKKGYVRSNGKCILLKSCPKPPTCGLHEEIKGCGACDGTCQDPNPACTLDCRPPECGCMKGYVRDNGKCILLKSCPKTPICGPNEELKGCGACDGTCKEKDVVCTADCRPPECGCKSGYVRNNGTCISYESCSETPICGPNEEIKGCGACDGTCKNPNPACTKICRQPECGCIKGYVRNNGTCIPSDHCSKTPSCGQHEEVKPCGACDGTCRKPHKMCTKECRPPACGCKKGYVRRNKKCVHKSKCNKKCHK